MTGPANFLQGRDFEAFIQRAKALLDQGESARAVARRLGISQSTLLSRIARAQKQQKAQP